MNSYTCAKCLKDIELDEEIWADPFTGEATMDGVPYHVECAPNEY